MRRNRNQHEPFQTSAHSTFSVCTNWTSFHYYFEMTFCRLSQLCWLSQAYDLERPWYPFKRADIRPPCTRGRRLCPMNQSLGASTSADGPDHQYFSYRAGYPHYLTVVQM